MYWLTEIVPQPMPTKLVPEFSKVKLCTLSLKVKGGSNWNIKLWLGSFQSLKISMHYLNRRYFTHVFWLGICKLHCVILYFMLHTHIGKEKGIEIWRSELKYSSLFAAFVSERVLCMWIGRYSMRGTVVYFQESYIELLKYQINRPVYKV